MFYNVVRNFMSASDQTIGIFNEEQTKLYFDLCKEEYKEYFDASSDEDKLDACCDLAWVAIGCLISTGIRESEFNDKISGYLMNFYVDECTVIGINEITDDDFDFTSMSSVKAKSSYFKFILASMGEAFKNHWLFLPAFFEVARSNISKIDPVTGTVIKREDGKVLKPANWTPPDLSRFV